MDHTRHTEGKEHYENAEAEGPNADGTGSEDPAPEWAVSQQGKKGSSRWGGRREGAGRKPKKLEDLSIFMQLGVMLTPEEKRALDALNLTPAQRRHRLFFSHPMDVDSSGKTGVGTAITNSAYRAQPLEAVVAPHNAPESAVRRQYNVRIALSSLEERDEIIAIPVEQRRLRLLTEPAGGDIEDERPGHWRRDKGDEKSN
ncbi:MAG: hypothetical protein M3441_04205 [Chloroflexota bacterium]|nr:hypothetical protein [Chloroflexota bacterium]